ncbi:SCP2 sterol-binding domain-containing protein [Amphritea sp. HPY]|uniref:SCP2 sterol-binding domain-containing protein n=1 Tax=Amphritea sp. HPY TaxID=3421652 RepID=UPI003D7EB5DC
MKLLKTAVGRKLVSGLAQVNRLKHRYSGSKQNTQIQVNLMSDTQAMFDTMASRFNATAAADLDAVFQYKLDEGDAYYAAIADGSCAVEQGEHDEPSVTLMMDSQTFQEVLDGETDGMQAFMTGRIRAEGDVMLATRLATLFPV